MMYRRMFVVYIQKGNKKERLYYKANNIKALSEYLWVHTNYEVAQIKQLKRIYRKKDVFEVV